MAALAADVNTLARGLAATEQRRTQLLGDVAHEMRTPLTVLDGYVEGIIDGVFHADASTLEALSLELRRLHRLADDLSTLSRAQEGRLAPALEPCDLAVLARSTAERLRPQFDDAHVAVDIHLPDAMPLVADPERVTQVLTNLLGNALVATSSGGRVRVEGHVDGARLRIEVVDSGVGLEVADQERIFERFYRAPNALRRSPGSGIGLTIAREIARAHHGSLVAQSDGPGRGSTFTLTLPRTSL
jgi:histidine kinase